LIELNAFLADRMLSQIEYSKDTGKNQDKNDRTYKKNGMT